MSKRSNFCLLFATTLCFVATCYIKPQKVAFNKDIKHTVDVVKDASNPATTYKVYERMYICELANLLNYEPRAINAQKIDNGVRYVLDNGNHIERVGGTIAWRNNNPGCIRYSTKTVKMGAIGTANGFAVFPDEQTGMNAIKTLLTSENYRDLTVANAITKYAPPHENDTKSYITKLCRGTGLKQDQKICDLNDSLLTKVVHTIRILEGWHEGTEKFIPTNDVTDPTKELLLLNTINKSQRLSNLVYTR